MIGVSRSSRSGRSIALALVLTAVISTRASAADDLYKHLGSLFVTAAHRNGELAAPTQKLSRWAVPLRVAVAGRRFAAWQPRIRAFLAELAEATGKDMTIATELPVNVAVLFADGFAADSEQVPVFKALLQNAIRHEVFVTTMAEADRTGRPCFWIVFRNEAGNLDSGILMVAERAPQRAQELCVFPWLVGISGVTTWNIDTRTIAAELLAEPSEGSVTLSPTGRLLLQMIYDPRLRDGMRVDETLPLLRAIVSGLR